MTRRHDMTTDAASLAEDEGARGIGVLLNQLDEGRFHAEVSEELQRLAGELGQHANDVGKAEGTITVLLKLKATDDGTISIDADVKVKSPKPRRARSLFWLTKGNNLTLDNPKQQKLPLREVPGRGAARDAGGADAGAARNV